MRLDIKKLFPSPSFRKKKQEERRAKWRAGVEKVGADVLGQDAGAAFFDSIALKRRGDLNNPPGTPLLSWPEPASSRLVLRSDSADADGVPLSAHPLPVHQTDSWNRGALPVSTDLLHSPRGRICARTTTNCFCIPPVKCVYNSFRNKKEFFAAGA